MYVFVVLIFKYDWLYRNLKIYLIVSIEIRASQNWSNVEDKINKKKAEIQSEKSAKYYQGMVKF